MKKHLISQVFVLSVFSCRRLKNANAREKIKNIGRGWGNKDG